MKESGGCSFNERFSLALRAQLAEMAAGQGSAAWGGRACALVEAAFAGLPDSGGPPSDEPLAEAMALDSVERKALRAGSGDLAWAYLAALPGYPMERLARRGASAGGPLGNSLAWLCKAIPPIPEMSRDMHGYCEMMAKAARSGEVAAAVRRLGELGPALPLAAFAKPVEGLEAAIAALGEARAIEGCCVEGREAPSAHRL